MPSTIKRCPWPVEADPLYVAYHDEEWGVPVRDDRKLFEFLVLEAFQAGLSWRCVLHKRENFRKAFAGFDYVKVARFGPREVARLVKDAGIIRNRAKIEATIHNARRFLEVRQEFGTFARYMWAQIGGKPRVNKVRSMTDYQAVTPEALAWAKDLKKRGFKFLGPTVVYAHMQAVGMVNDHLVSCFRYRQVSTRYGGRLVSGLYDGDHGIDRRDLDHRPQPKTLPGTHRSHLKYKDLYQN